MAGFINKLTGFFTISRQHNPHFEAASKSRRMGGFDPAKKHINKAIEECGDTIVARSRWLYDNEALYGSATEEWVSAAVSDGIKPYPRIEGFQEEKKKLLDLWWQWVDEADYDEDTSFYGLQATIAREVFLTGECFVRLHYVDLYGRSGVPLQLQVYPTEMLDLSYNGPAEIEAITFVWGLNLMPVVSVLLIIFGNITPMMIVLQAQYLRAKSACVFLLKWSFISKSAVLPDNCAVLPK